MLLVLLVCHCLLAREPLLAGTPLVWRLAWQQQQVLQACLAADTDQGWQLALWREWLVAKVAGRNPLQGCCCQGRQQPHQQQQQLLGEQEGWLRPL